MIRGSAPGVLCLVLGPPVQGMYVLTRAAPVKGCKDDGGTGSSLVCREAERVGASLAGEEKTQGFYPSVEILGGEK